MEKSILSVSANKFTFGKPLTYEPEKDIYIEEIKLDKLNINLEEFKKMQSKKNRIVIKNKIIIYIQNFILNNIKYIKITNYREFNIICNYPKKSNVKVIINNKNNISYNFEISKIALYLHKDSLEEYIKTIFKQFLIKEF